MCSVVDSFFSNDRGRIIHNNGFDAEECAFYAKIAVDDTLMHMDVILKAMTTLGIEFTSPASKVGTISYSGSMWLQIFKMLAPSALDQEYVKIFYAYFGGDSAKPVGTDVKMDFNLANAISELWKDEGVQSCFHRYREYQLGDSAE